MQEFDFLACSTAVVEGDNSGNLCRLNPFLSNSDAKMVKSATMMIMMATNRVSQTTLALTQCRSAFKILRLLHSACRSNLNSNQVVLLKKELVSIAENLAATLTSRRHFSSKTSTIGCFDVDPRFLLFEFSHGLLLRSSQVELVRKLLQDMDAGRSVCHQVLTLSLCVFFSMWFRENSDDYGCWKDDSCRTITRHAFGHFKNTCH